MVHVVGSWTWILLTECPWSINLQPNSKLPLQIYEKSKVSIYYQPSFGSTVLNSTKL
jgi:hypothetical protein